MIIKKIDGIFTVCQVEDYQEVKKDAAFCFIQKTDEENSLVCLEADAPAKTIKRDDGWKAFRIEGVLDFSLIGILAKISAILADHAISIFALSTYNTDYVLVKEENYEEALAALQGQGYEVD